MLNAYFIVFLLGLLLVSPSAAQRVDLQAVVAYLASDQMNGRDAGSKESEVVAGWIADHLEAFGLKPLVGERFFQPFSYRTGKEPVHAVNISGKLGKGPVRLLLTAHYDHLGKGDLHSLEVFKDQVHNGADDNASGVAVLLQLAERFSQLPDVDGIGCIFFSGHEDGLYGSTHFAHVAFSYVSSLQWVVNLDMVGRLDILQSPSPLYVRVPEQGKASVELLQLEATEQLKPVVKTATVPLDDQAFHALGVRTCTFSTGLHADYHRTTDDPSSLNYAGMELVSAYIFRFVQNILNK